VVKEVDDDVGSAVERSRLEPSRGEEAVAEFGERDDLVVALGGVGEERGEFGGDVLGCEVVLKKFGDEAAAGDEVGHGDWQVTGSVGHVGELVRVADEAFRQGEGEGRDPINDDKRVSHNGREDSGGSAGYNGGAGVMESLSGIRHKS
jgi:hypothetical protein